MTSTLRGKGAVGVGVKAKMSVIGRKWKGWG